MIAILAALIERIPAWVLYIIIALLAALLGAQTVRLTDARFAAVTAQAETARAKQEKAEIETAIAEANAQAEAKAKDLQRQVTEAQNEAAKREIALRSAADRARTESDGLRSDAENLRRSLADASREAVLDRAAAVTTVLGQCATRYQVLAESCDRHVSDLRTLIDAWPH